MTYRKKLIEVALPLEAINEASVRESYIYKGNPSSIHKWWAQRPLSASRAVVFASLVDDPDNSETSLEFIEACKSLPKGKNASVLDTPRQRLFDFIEQLVTWETINDKALLDRAKELIRIATNGNPPHLLDPFAGGGSIPLEAQRLGLEVTASDLNPVAVMINKALIEIPPKFINLSPVNPSDQTGTGGKAQWEGAAGLASDIRYYGNLLWEKARNRIGVLYPDHKNEKVIAWLWARTVLCPNPGCRIQMPLLKSFNLSTRSGKSVWVDPQVNPTTREISFIIPGASKGKGPKGTVNRQGAVCFECGTPVKFEHIRSEGKAGRMNAQLIAIVTQGKNGRTYYSPSEDQERIAKVSVPDSVPDTDLPEQALGFRVQLYGMTKHRDLFTNRQLVCLTTFYNLIPSVRAQIEQDAILAKMDDDNLPLRHSGIGARAYSEAISIYLSFAIDKYSLYGSTLVPWYSKEDRPSMLFARHAMPMVWDYAEINPFTNIGGSILRSIDIVADSIEPLKNNKEGVVFQADASNLEFDSEKMIVSCDPPYYDNIGYADLSDFFYIWLRPFMKSIYPRIFETLLVPKEQELISSKFRFGGDNNLANEHFESGLKDSFSKLRNITHPSYPMTIYYAFKQQELVTGDNSASTGWEKMLNGLMDSGFQIVGTWPIRTERRGRMISIGTNALASSIVLVNRIRPDDAPRTSRREFVNALREELPPALRDMQSGNIAPVDLAQASIGPGMAVFSRYSKVLEPNGDQMTVRSALQLINNELDTYLAEQEGYIDEDSRFAVSWFEQFGFQVGAFGQADVLARAKNTSVGGMITAGVLESGAGKVRLLHWSELDPGWDPDTDQRLTTWEATHHLIEQLNSHGEEGAARLLSKMEPDLVSEARQLAYRLYSICDRKGWAEHARDYNALVVSWGASQEQAREFRDQYQQGNLF